MSDDGYGELLEDEDGAPYPEEVQALTRWVEHTLSEVHLDDYVDEARDLIAAGVASTARPYEHEEPQLRAALEALGRVRIHGDAWVGFDESHSYGDAILEALGPEVLSQLDGGASPVGMRLTGAEWRAFQQIPDQGYSHRAWVDARIQERVEQALDEVLRRADGGNEFGPQNYLLVLRIVTDVRRRLRTEGS